MIIASRQQVLIPVLALGLASILGCGGQPSEDNQTAPGGVPRPTVNMVVEGTGPANLNNIHVTGSASASATVDLYSNSSCSAFVSSTTADGAGNFSFALTVLDDSTNTYFAKQTTTDGASPCSTTFAVFVEDSTASPPTLTSTPTSPSYNNNPTLTATTEGGATVYVYTDAACTSAASPASGTANSSGAFSLNMTVPSDAITNFYAKIVDVAGNISACSSTAYAYQEDSTAPAVPAVSGITPTGPADNNAPVLAGTAEAGVSVRIYSNSGCTTQIASGNADGAGNFSITVNVADDTTTTMYWRAQDPAGNQSACSNPTSITYVEHTTTPAPATPTLMSSTPGSPANNNSPSINGTTDPTVTVTLFSDSSCTTSIASGSSNGSGAFSIPISVSDNTSIAVYARASSGGVNSACTSSPLTYIEDSTAPNKPTLTSTTPDVIGTTTSPIVNGSTNEAGASITIYSDSGCTTSIGSGTANGSGNFSISVTAASNATTTLYAKATDAAGNTLGCTTTPRNYTHDNVAPGVPTISSSSPNSPSSSNTPTLSGSAEANSTVKIYYDSSCNTQITSGTATGGGAFSIPIAVSSDSATNIYTKATDAAGNSSACSSTAFTYTEDSTAPAAPTITSTSPASPSSTNNPTVIGTAEFYAVVAIYTDSACTGTVYGTGSASGSGNFSVALSSNLPSDTTSALYAKATDLAGNSGPCSSSAFNYTEDSTPPANPSLTSTTPTSPSSNNSPTVNGGGTEAGASVTLYSDASCTTSIGSGTANGSGAFAVSVTFASDSNNNIYARAADTAGNLSSCTGPLNYIEDSTAPAAPTVAGTTPSLRSDLQAATVDGTAEALANVKVYSDSGCSTQVGSGSANGGGNFSVSITAPWNQTVTYYAKATDAAGNASGCSATSASYEAYNIPDGVGVFTGTQCAAGADLNQATASALRYTTADFDSGTYTHSLTTNPERIYVSTAGDYQVSMNIPGTGAVTAGALRAEIRVNGSVRSATRAQNYYTASASAHDHSSIGATYLIENLSANDYIDVTIQRHGAAGTINADGKFSVYMEKVASSRVIYTATTTTGLSGGNINTPNTLVWTDSIKDTGFTHTSGTSDITLDAVGTYVIHANIPGSGAVANGNVRVIARINGTPVTGGEAKQGYISNTSGHIQSSMHWSGLVTTNSANSVLSLATNAEGNTGTISLPAGNPASVFVERLSTTADVFFGQGTTHTNGTDFNTNTANSAVQFTTENLEDGAIYTHATSGTSEQVQVSTFGDYLLMFNAGHTSTGNRVNSTYSVTVNGTPVTGAQSDSFYMRGSGGNNESSGTMVYLLRRLNANDIVRLNVLRETSISTATTNQNTSLVLVRKPYQ